MFISNSDLTGHPEYIMATQLMRHVRQNHIIHVTSCELGQIQKENMLS